MEQRARVNVTVEPRARKRDVEVVDGVTLRIRVTAPAVDGRANEAVCELLADVLHVPKRSIEIVSGHRGRRKIIELPLVLSEILERLAETR